MRQSDEGADRDRVGEVVYKAGIRPSRWEQGETIIEMAFDRLGRRVWMWKREWGAAGLNGRQANRRAFLRDP